MCIMRAGYTQYLYILILHERDLKIVFLRRGRFKKKENASATIFAIYFRNPFGGGKRRQKSGG